MPEVRYDKSHHAGGDAETRIQNRLRNSGSGAKPTSTTESWPQRTVTNIHHGASQHQHGNVKKGEER
jgi:hypothetical protein